MKKKTLVILTSILAVILVSCTAAGLIIGRNLRYSGTFPTSVRGSVPTVLTYHLVSDEVFGNDDYLFVRPSEFEEQLELLSDRGYTFLFADEWGIFDFPSVIITFDDGYTDNYTEMYPLLKKYNAKATVFLISDMIGHEYYLTEEQIKEMSDSGLVSFQSHTAGHSPLTELTEDELYSELKNSAEKIERITDKKVTVISYPNGKYTYSLLDSVSEIYTFGYTTEYPPAVLMHGEYNIPRYYIGRGDGSAGLEEIIGNR